MKSLYQTTLEQFTGTQELKEGDYVVCPMYPNKAVKIYKASEDIYYFVYKLKSRSILFSKDGKSFNGDDFPLFLKCSPPKKKVKKVFSGYVALGACYDEFETIIFSKRGGQTLIKAKLIVEVDE
jgi:hypothetical protein